MKKILLSMIALFIAIAASAETFNGKLAICIDPSEGYSDPEDATITVDKQDDGTYTFMLVNFSFSGLSIGDATVSGIKGTEENGAIVLKAENADAPVTGGILGDALVGRKVVMTMTATIKDGVLTAIIDPIAVTLDLGTGPATMPVKAVFGPQSYVEDFVKNATGISSVNTTADKAARIYDLSGRQLPAMQKGLNIVKTESGKTVKVMK